MSQINFDRINGYGRLRHTDKPHLGPANPPLFENSLITPNRTDKH